MQLRIFLSAAFAIFFAVGIFCYSAESSKGVLNGIEFCITLLVPSLFPFMVLAAFIADSGIPRLLEPILSPIMGILFKLPGVCGVTFLLSLVGGYPIGAKGVASLYTQGLITQHEAQKMSYFCVCAGPGFLVTFVGTGLYGNYKIGLILMLAQIASVVIIGVVCRFAIKEETVVFPQEKPSQQKKSGFMSALVSSVNSGVTGIVGMCGAVVAFSAFIGIAAAFFEDYSINCGFLLHLAEVASACKALSKNVPLELMGFIVGWGGLCVHFQIYSFLKNVKINRIFFIAMRGVQGLLTAMITHFLLPLFPISQEVFYSNIKSVAPVLNYSGVFGSAGLILTAFCFIAFLYNFKLRGS